MIKPETERVSQQPLMGCGVIIVEIVIKIDIQRFDSNNITLDSNPDTDTDYDFDFSRLFSNAVTRQ